MERARTCSRLPLLVSALLAAIGVAAIAYSSARGGSEAEPRVDRVAVQRQSRAAEPGQGGFSARGHEALACPDDPLVSIARLRKLRVPLDEPHAPHELERPALQPHAYVV